MNTLWSKTGNSFFLREISNQNKVLPTSIYKISMTPTNELYLEQVQDKFKFPYKIYGFERTFIDWILKTYENTSSNLGVLMNGIRGTGKTVACEMICNELNNPVIIVDKNLPGLVDFISSIQQHVTLFFDEFEKVFKQDDYDDLGSPLLTLMDGVMKNEYRKVFLLTTNELRIEPNLLQRPGRIRYKKTFGNLSKAVVAEIVDDLLAQDCQKYRGDIVEFVSKLEIITVDIVTAVLNEVNIHKTSPDAFKEFFNTKQVDDVFDVYQIEDGKPETLIYERAKVRPYMNEHTDDIVDCTLYINNKGKGEIKSFENQIVEVDSDSGTARYRFQPRWGINGSWVL